MTTRSGSIDAGALIYLLRERGMTVDALEQALNYDSGLKALSGTSGDMIEIEQRAGAGDRDARFALDVFVHRVACAVGSMSAAAGGIDALAFTGGIGEGSMLVRARIAERLGFLGVTLDRHETNVWTGSPMLPHLHPACACSSCVRAKRS